MGTRHVRLDEEFYEWVESQNRESETLSETLERLTRRPDLFGLRALLETGGLDDARAAADTVRDRSDRRQRARMATKE
jgi:hypothetical protein